MPDLTGENRPDPLYFRVSLLCLASLVQDAISSIPTVMKFRLSK